MIKVSAKEVKANFPRVLAVPYCAAQNLLRFKTSQFYTAGIYGKNADVFAEGDVAIATGYRPFGKKARFVKKYDEKAKQYFEQNKTASYEVFTDGLHKIILEWIKEEFAEELN